MTVSQFGGGTRRRPPVGGGRPPKGGVHRRVVQAKIPPELFDVLVQTAEEMDQTLTDLGAYYLIQGWNMARAEQGLTLIPMPEYLEQRLHEQPGVAQDVLEESLLKVS